MLHKKITVGEKKTIALVAHDHRKDDLLNWVYKHKTQLENHNLVGTGNTASLISERTGLEVEALISGPLGGDQQLGARICEGKIDILIFFWDPLEALPHDPDVKALLRICTLYNIALASSSTTATYLISSPLFTSSYQVEVIDNDHILSVGHGCKKDGMLK